MELEQVVIVVHRLLMRLVSKLNLFSKLIHLTKRSSLSLSLASQQYTLAIIRPNAHADAKTVEISDKVNTIYSLCLLALQILFF